MQARTKLALSLTVVSMVLGVMVSLQYRQTMAAHQAGLGGFAADTEASRLEAQLNALKEANTAASQQLTNLTNQLTHYEQVSTGSSRRLQAMQGKLEDERILAGVTPVEGPGIMVTLMDGIANGSNTEQVLTHDWDVRSVINELFTAGAEAVSINGYRVVATSGIFCIGPVVRINGHPIGAPFEIDAIGNPKTLLSALNIQGGILDALRSRGVQVSEPKQVGSITMPAFTSTPSASGGSLS